MGQGHFGGNFPVFGKNFPTAANRYWHFAKNTRPFPLFPCKRGASSPGAFHALLRSFRVCSPFDAIFWSATACRRFRFGGEGNVEMVLRTLHGHQSGGKPPHSKVRNAPKFSSPGKNSLPPAIAPRKITGSHTHTTGKESIGHALSLVASPLSDGPDVDRRHFGCSCPGFALRRRRRAFPGRRGRPRLSHRQPRLSRLSPCHAKFFILLTVVFGAITGVGIWWTIGLASPLATEMLIRTFVFGWATEWVFFVVEIVSAFIFFYYWGRLRRKYHVAIGWIYAVAAWISLVLITGITAFMLNPGVWAIDPKSQNFWTAFSIRNSCPKRPREPAALLLSSLFVYLHASFSWATPGSAT